MTDKILVTLGIGPLRGSAKYRKAWAKYFRAFGRMNAAFDEIQQAMRLHRSEDDVLCYQHNNHESSLAAGDIHPVYISLPSTLGEALAGCDRVNCKGDPDDEGGSE